ncbi:hypothetical protein [Leptospira vanthielii]|uniref:hypothetical protein n=1 Tax=Leptospira vanthielii TaxID=293085 RepID=UPI0002DBAEA3|nr:hypothetical protein [Leptospira vanthielii]
MICEDWRLNVGLCLQPMSLNIRKEEYILVNLLFTKALDVLYTFIVFTKNGKLGLFRGLLKKEILQNLLSFQAVFLFSLKSNYNIQIYDKTNFP